MKKKSLTLLVAATLASSVLFSSCIGSFGLSNKLLDWNRNIDSKFVNELVFVAFWIVPVYEISALADILVLNSIEFWSGSNPVADAGTVKTNGESTKLLKFTGDDEVVMYLPDGKEMNVELNQAGVLAFKQVAEGYSFYAAR